MRIFYNDRFITGLVEVLFKIEEMLMISHYPIYLCGMICGPLYGLTLGMIYPVLLFVIREYSRFDVENGIFMFFMMGATGYFSGKLYRKKTRWNRILAVPLSMVLGRMVMLFALLGMYGMFFSWTILFRIPMTAIGMFSDHWLPSALQVVLIPLMVMWWEKYFEKPLQRGDVSEEMGDVSDI